MKALKDLTISNNFMFAAVMSQGDNCKKLLEMVLGIEIDHVDVDREKSIVYNPQYKGIRLDVYAKDENRSRYNVEMQVKTDKKLGKRARYYHSQVDMDMLMTGVEYESLPQAYVIFICDFDPYHDRRYQYSFENRCAENTSLTMGDESRTIFLSTRGKNEAEVSPELVKFLHFVRAKNEQSMEDFDDPFVRQLQRCIQQIKADRDMENKFMMWEQWIKDERKEERIETMVEFIMDFLKELGPISSDLSERIHAETDVDVLKNWHKLAAKSTSIEDFMSKM